MIKREERFTRRLETEFSSGETKHRGISSDLSEKGLFIRTQHGLAPGSILDIVIYLPEKKTARVRGVVRRTIKTQMDVVKNGMGIELIERDINYINFIKTYIEPPKEDGTLIITCSSCGVKNRVPKLKLNLGPRCGNCKAVLNIV